MGKRPKVTRLANDEESAEDPPVEDEDCADEVGEGPGEGEEGGKKVRKKWTEIAILLDTAAVQAMVKTGGLHAAKRLLEGQNWCDVASVESMLTSGGHYDELVALYRSHGLHRKALDLLLQIAREPGSLPFPSDSPPVTGPGPLTDYLKELGSKEESLVLEYSEWLLQAYPQEALQLYSSLQPPLPSAVVLQHLRDHAPGLQAAYLEHMLEGGGNKTAGLEADTSNGLQDELVQLYMEKVLEERRRGGAVWDEIRHSEARTKLLQLLRRASAYSHPEALLEQLPGDALLEERALLLGRLGRHRQALSIFARKLKDPVLALGYCDSVHDVLAAHNGPAHTLPSLAPEATIGETNESIYFSLLTIYLDPTVGTSEFVSAVTYATPPPTPTLTASIYDIPPPASLTNASERRPSRGGARKIAHIEEDPHGSPNGSPTSQQLQGAVPLSSWLGGWGQAGQPGGNERAEEDTVVKAAKKGFDSDVMVDEALDLMGRRWDHISGIHALRMLPEGTELWKLLPYFLPLLRRESEAKRNAAVVQSLRRSENFQVREALVQCKTRVVRVTANTMCSICRKRVGTSAFAVNPNNTIMHFVCFRDAQRAKSPRSPKRSAPATSAGP